MKPPDYPDYDYEVVTAMLVTEEGEEVAIEGCGHVRARTLYRGEELAVLFAVPLSLLEGNDDYLDSRMSVIVPEALRRALGDAA